MLTLFLELALIRWTAANNVHLANISSFCALASFLGIGVGFCAPALSAARLLRGSELREDVANGMGGTRAMG